MLSMEPFGWKYMLSWWLVILGGRSTLQPKDKELWDPWSFFFGGIWVHVQVLESLLWLSGFEAVMLVTCFCLKWYIRLLNVDQVVQIGAADACAPQTLVCIWSGVPFTAKHHTNRNIFRLSLNSWVCFVCVCIKTSMRYCNFCLRKQAPQIWTDTTPAMSHGWVLHNANWMYCWQR